MTDNARKDIAATFTEIASNFEALQMLTPELAEAGAVMVAAVKGGGKIMFCGNGGSAADSQHLAAELVGRYLKERPPIAAIALTTDTSVLTALSNDYSCDYIFERQLRALGRKGDALIAISTSGNSINVINAAKAARELGIKVIALTGSNSSLLLAEADIALRVPATATNRVQELHIAIGHVLCGIVEDSFA